MKKIRLLLLLLCALLFSLSVFAVSSAAEDDSITSANVWKVTHSDGSVEYTEAFNKFKPFKEGDVYEFLPDTYELFSTEYANIRADVNVTFDLRGSIITCPEDGDVNAQAISVSSGNGSKITFLMEDAEIHGALGGRCVFSTGGNLEFVMDGGVRGGKIFGGSSINSNTNCTDPNMYSTVKNMYMFKSTGNMNGLVGARNKSKLRLVDCYVISPDGKGNPIYIVNGSLVVLENTKVLRLNAPKSNVVDFGSPADGAGLIVGAGSFVYGVIRSPQYISEGTFEDCIKIEMHHGSYYTQDMSAYVDSGKYLFTDANLTYKDHIETSFEVGVKAKTDIEVPFVYSVLEKYTETDSFVAGDKWKLEQTDGTVSYSNSATPLAAGIRNYKKATLIAPLELADPIIINMTSDLTLDLSSHKLTISDTDSVEHIIVSRGEGRIALEFGENEIYLTEGLLYSENSLGASISFAGRAVASGIAVVENGDLAVSGGNYLALSGNAFSALSGNLDIKDATVYSEAGKILVCASGDMCIGSSSLLTVPDALAVSVGGKLELSEGVYICGRSESKEFVSADNCYFVKTPYVESSDIIIVGENHKKSFSVIIPKDGGYALSEKDYTFFYKTEAYVLTDSKNDNSIWQIELKDGSIKYAKHLYVPFGYIGEYVKLTLLKDIKIEQILSFKLSGDVELDFSGRTVTKEITFPSEGSILKAEGVGRLSLNIKNSVFDIEGAVLVSSNSITALDIEGEGAYVKGSSIVKSSSTPVSVNSGYYVAKSGLAFELSSGKLSLRTLSAVGEGSSPLISSDSDVTVYEDVKLLAKSTACAVYTSGALIIAEGTYVSGTVKALSIITEGYSYFTAKPSVESINMIVINERTNVELESLSLKNGKVTAGKSEHLFYYRTAHLNEDIKVNMTLLGSAALNVYVPFSVTKSDKDFKIRIVVDGLLYEAKADSGSKMLVEGKSYVKFTYDYIYPTAYSERIELTLVSGSFTEKMYLEMSDLLSRSLTAAEEESVKKVIASYTAFVMAVSGYDRPLPEDVAAYAGSYKKKNVDNSVMERYVDYIRYDANEQKIVFVRKNDAEVTLKFFYTYGTESMKYEFAPGDVCAIPIYRLDHSVPIRVNVDGDGIDESFTLNIHSLIAFTAESTDASRYLTLYGAYLATLK